MFFIRAQIKHVVYKPYVPKLIISNCKRPKHDGSYSSSTLVSFFRLHLKGILSFKTCSASNLQTTKWVSDVVILTNQQPTAQFYLEEGNGKN